MPCHVMRLHVNCACSARGAKPLALAKDNFLPKVVTIRDLSNAAATQKFQMAQQYNMGQMT
jgi:hypothetical protein